MAEYVSSVGVYAREDSSLVVSGCFGLRIRFGRDL